MAFLDRGPYGEDEGGPGTASGPPKRFPAVGALRWGLSALLAAGLGFAIWQAYADRQTGTEPTIVPIILAEDRPVKVEPSDPGGETVPHQEVSIYQRLENPTGEEPDDGAGDAEAGAVRETEQSVGQPRAAEDPEDPDDATGAGDGAEGDATREPAEEPAGAAPADTAERTDGEVADDGYAPPPRREYRTMAEAIGPYRIQMGAYRTPEAAYDRWVILFRQNNDLLRNLDLIIERADQDDGQVVYRLQAGPLRTPEEVRGLCEQLRRREIRCALVEV